MDDITEAFVKIAESDMTIGKTMNAGSNYEVSIGDTANIIARLMNKEIEIISDEARLKTRKKARSTGLWADNSKIKEFTDWQLGYAGINGFKKGLEHCIEWYADPHNLSLF